jgi:hypothetical protein
MEKGFILWFLILVPVMAILILSENKSHARDKMRAGIILKKITISKKQQFVRIIKDSVIVIFIIFIFPLIRKMNSTIIDLPILYFILPIFMGVIVALIFNRPQIICENGILDRFALIEWSNIKKVKKSNTCDNEIIIILQTPIHKNNSIKIGCLPEDIDNVIELIESKINKENSQNGLE